MIEIFALAVATLGLGSQPTARWAGWSPLLPPSPVAIGVGPAADARVQPTSSAMSAEGHGKQSGVSSALFNSLRNISSNGDLPVPIIRRYLHRIAVRLQHCYDEALERRPNLEGNVTVAFAISNRGRVVSIDARGVTSEVSSCVARTISAVEFPAPRGGGMVQVNLTLNFRPNSPRR
jgi:hypothetical protein